MSTPDLILHHAPRTRSMTALWFLEELGLPYRMERFDIQSGHQKSPEFLRLNPAGKVPVVIIDGVAVSERLAIIATLADRFAPGRLAPTADHPERGAYFRWLSFAVGNMEPAFGQAFFKWTGGSTGQIAWGSFDLMLAQLRQGLEGREYLLDMGFTGADVLVGSMVHFGIAFKAIPAEPPFITYLERLQARPALQSALKKD
jgi:glutathione S-transferase